MAFFIRRTTLTWTKLEVDGEIEGLRGVDGMMGVVRVVHVEGMMAEQGVVAEQGMVVVVCTEGVVAEQGMVEEGVEEGVKVALGSETVHHHQHQLITISLKNYKTHLSSGHIWIFAFSKNRR